MKTPPKAFISHSSEDKERFVNEFALRLRSRGIDAWLDVWEIKAGDSLVGKIFEEGIKNADAFIIVISTTSSAKRWVREELDAGMVRRIEDSCRLIPVIIDDCEIPQSVKHIKWIRIKDTQKYDDELAEISNSILGANDKPSIGKAPAHFSAALVRYLPNITKADNLVFGVLCRHFLKKGNAFFQTAEVCDQLDALELSESEIDESLRILAGRGFISISTIQRETIWGIDLKSHSLDAFMRLDLPDYDRKVLDIISAIVNEGLNANEPLHKRTAIAMPIILHVLTLLNDKGLIDVTGPAGFPILHITRVSPELKRILRQT
jgi:TIR domain-containing protein